MNCHIAEFVDHLFLRIDFNVQPRDFHEIFGKQRRRTEVDILDRGRLPFFEMFFMVEIELLLLSSRFFRDHVRLGFPAKLPVFGRGVSTGSAADEFSPATPGFGVLFPDIPTILFVTPIVAIFVAVTNTHSTHTLETLFAGV